MTDILPYLTASLGGIGGRIKQRVEDFRVDEQPLYQPCGEGTHIYFRIEKRGIPTPVALGRLARHMGVRPGDIGLAGLKDAVGITTQYLSLEHCDQARLASYADAQLRVIWTGRHTNKLKTGHLAGNRFAIRIRDVAAESPLDQARAILDVLAARGVPNYFGSQRFGARGDTAALGRAIISGDLERFVSLFLGGPRSSDPPDCRAARDEFDVGAWDKALKHWPRHYVDQRKALSAYKKKRRPHQALAAVDKRMKRLYVSAAQSEIFNAVLARRLDSIDTLCPGDLACKHDTGGVFLVEDVQAELPRVQAGLLSPTGPLPGYRAKLASGEPGLVEREIVDAAGLDLEQFRNLGPLKAKGTRRPLRFILGEPSISAGQDEHGEYIELAFTAPSGCYATVVVEEICKNRKPYTVNDE